MSPPASLTTRPATAPVPTVTPAAPTTPPLPPASPIGQTAFNAENAALQEFATGLERPLYLTHAGDGSGRVFVVEQAGRILVVEADGRAHGQPFLDIRERVASGGERGLLSAAFHPDYETNGFFYVDYTDLNGDTVVERYRVSQDDPNRADPQSRQMILFVRQPAANHNGGLLLFGPDGYLYVGLGDGGGGNSANGQRKDTLLGKLLRIDVDQTAGDQPYAIPPDNPFVNDPDVRSEIWATGLRNPWRFSFDRASGDLYIGDVGSATFEEINFQPGGSPGGENYGWNVMEGSACRQAASDCGSLGLVLPVAEYDRGSGCVVIGGYVYRGLDLPALTGIYLFADYCRGRIWGLSRDAAGNWVMSELMETGLLISSFGEDEAGELYAVDLGGKVFRLVAAPSR